MEVNDHVQALVASTARWAPGVVLTLQQREKFLLTLNQTSVFQSIVE
jgi:hypothetical protein